MQYKDLLKINPLEMVEVLLRNDKLVFNLYKISFVASKGIIVTVESFNIWVEMQIRDLQLIDGIHFKYRIPNEISSIYVRGYVGLAILAHADNEVGLFVQHFLRRNHFPAETLFNKILEGRL